MRRAGEEWTDARLNDLAAALEPVPSQVAVLNAAVTHLETVVAALERIPSDVAVLAATAERLTDENRGLRQELAATQRQLIQIGWALTAALLGAGAALIAAVL
jgi:hypothetical protein